MVDGVSGQVTPARPPLTTNELRSYSSLCIVDSESEGPYVAQLVKRVGAGPSGFQLLFHAATASPPAHLSLGLSSFFSRSFSLLYPALNEHPANGPLAPSPPVLCALRYGYLPLLVGAVWMVGSVIGGVGVRGGVVPLRGTNG
jgi:hypothetical protein